MEEKIIATFCLCDDLLKATWHQESSFPQQLNDAEIMTIALVVCHVLEGVCECRTTHELPPQLALFCGCLAKYGNKSDVSGDRNRSKMDGWIIHKHPLNLRVGNLSLV